MGHVQDRGRGHGQEVRIIAFAQELLALPDPKLVLLIDDRQTEIRLGPGFIDQRVGSNRQPQFLACGSLDAICGPVKVTRLILTP